MSQSSEPRIQSLPELLSGAGACALLLAEASGHTVAFTKLPDGVRRIRLPQPLPSEPHGVWALGPIAETGSFALEPFQGELPDTGSRAVVLDAGPWEGRAGLYDRLLPEIEILRSRTGAPVLIWAHAWSSHALGQLAAHVDGI